LSARKSTPTTRRKGATAPAPVSAARPAGAATAWLLAATLALLTIAVYAPVRSHEFISLDDPGYIVDNPHVTTGLTWANVRWALTSGYAANWHPLTWVSHQADVSLFGVAPGRHHLTNVAWHVLTSLLLFGLLRAMTGAVWRSAFVAGLFALHPAHVESVAWVAERKDVLSAFLWVATTWAYVAWVRRPAVSRYGFVVTLFTLGLMAKPMLVTLPFTLLLLDVWPLDRSSIPWTRRAIEKLPLFVMALASSVVTATVQQSAAASLNVIALPDRVANAVLSYGRYVKMLVWPSDLAVLYPLVGDLPAAPVLLAGGVVAAITAFAWITRKSSPFVLVGWLWFLGTLVPVIGIMQVGVQALADRYTYIPSIGFFIALAWGGQALARRARVSAAALRSAALVLLVGAAILTRSQVATWATSETVWRQAVAATPRNPRARIELGVAYGKAGRPEDAAVQFEQALPLPLTEADAKDLFPNLAQSLVDQGKVAEAIPHFERACALSPERADLRNRLALAYFGVGRQDDAVASWREAVRLNPQLEEAWFTMGVVLAASGRIDEARRAFVEVLRISPSRKEAQDLLAKLGK